jgi:hypothetical protein
MLSKRRAGEPVFFTRRFAPARYRVRSRQDCHRGKAAICTAGTVGILIDLFSLLSVYNCPATNITAANIITNIALANCVTSLILPHQITDTRRYSRKRTLDLVLSSAVSPAL